MLDWQALTGEDMGSSAAPVAAPMEESFVYLEPERVVNGGFQFDVASWVCWILGAGGNSCVLSWDGSGVLDGGCLHLSFSGLTGSSYALAFQELGPVTAGQQLLCRFSMRGAVPHAPVIAELRQDASVAYEPLSYATLLESDPAREEHAFLLDVLSSEPNARLDLGMEEATQGYWIDNVSVRAIEVDETALSQRFLLLTNTSSKGTTTILPQVYLTPAGQVLPAGPPVVLDSMRSQLLIRP